MEHPQEHYQAGVHYAILLGQHSIDHLQVGGRRIYSCFYLFLNVFVQNRFTPCGRSLVVGDMEGTTHVCALDDMPFPPHFQYHELQAAIYQALLMKTELLSQVKSLGSLAYAKNDQRRTS